jgi:hypothetical protein
MALRFGYTGIYLCMSRMLGTTKKALFAPEPFVVVSCDRNYGVTEKVTNME